MAENAAVNSVVETGCFAEALCRPSILLRSFQCSRGLVQTELNKNVGNIPTGFYCLRSCSVFLVP